MHSSMARMERIPGFYFLYSSIFRKVMCSSDLHESTQDHTRDSFDVTITKCLWHTACIENDCPKLCHIFCDADNVTYGGLKKMAFSRTKTLGHGEDCCDFHFSPILTSLSLFQQARELLSIEWSRYWPVTEPLLPIIKNCIQTMRISKIFFISVRRTISYAVTHIFRKSFMMVKRR